MKCEELAQRRIEALRLFLLHPVPGFLDEVWPGEGRAGHGHGLERAGALISAPVAATGNEAGRHFDAAAFEGLQFGDRGAIEGVAVPVEAALKPGSAEFADIYLKLRVGEPGATFDFFERGRHVGRCGRHALVEIHHVVARQGCEIICAPGLQRVRSIVWPVVALAVKVSAQKAAEALGTCVHVGIRVARGVVALIMLARWFKRGEGGVDLWPWIMVRARRSREGCAQWCYAPEDVRMEQSAHCGHGRTEIVTDDRGDALMLERCEQGEDVADQVAQPK